MTGTYKAEQDTTTKALKEVNAWDNEKVRLPQALSPTLGDGSGSCLGIWGPWSLLGSGRPC